MALARSASGPGGLSINTSSANLFGGGTSSSQPPAASKLFGAAQPQTSQTSTSSGLFGGAAASTAPQAGGLFGGTTTTTSQPQQPAMGGLFGGGGGTTTSHPAVSGGLFGAAQPQQQQTTGLFGASTAAQPAQQQTAGGLFGGSTTQQQPQQTGGGLLGGGATNPAQPQQTGSSLFGGNAQVSQPAQTGGTFGASTQNQPQTQNTGGMFSSLLKQPQPAATTGTSMFGQPAQQKASVFGQPQSNPQQSFLGGLPPLGQLPNQTVPGVTVDVSNVKGTSRFNDLQEDLQKQIMQMDQIIQSYISQKNEVDAFMPAHGEMLSYLPNDVKLITRKFDGVQSALRSDAEAIESVRGLIQQDADSARLSFRAVDNLKLPQQYHTTGLWSSRQQSSSTANTETDGQELVSFFSKTADNMEQQLKKYEMNVTEIELHMRGVEDGLLEQLQKMMATRNGGPSGVEEKIAELGAVLRDFEMSILKVAGDVGGAREGMARLQLGDFLNHGDRNGVY